LPDFTISLLGAGGAFSWHTRAGRTPGALEVAAIPPYFVFSPIAEVFSDEGIP